MIRLLIADDERYAVDHIAQLFEGKCDFEFDVYRAYSAQEAMNISQKVKIDIAVLDIQMPVINGLKLAKVIKTAWPQSHLIFLTAFDEFDYIYAANKFSFSSFLLKTETDATIRSVITDHAAQIVNLAEEKVLLDQAKVNNLLLRQLTEQSILQEICFGNSSEALKLVSEASGATLMLQTEKPVWLALMHTEVNRGVKKKSAVDWLPYLGAMQRLTEKLFSFSMCCTDDNIVLWFFQSMDSEDTGFMPSPFTYLRTLLEDYVNSLKAEHDANLLVSMYPTAIAWTDISSVFEKISQESNEIWNQAWNNTAVTILKGSSVAAPHSDQVHLEQMLTDFHQCLLSNSNPSQNAAMDQLRQYFLQQKNMYDIEVINFYYRLLLVLKDEIQASGIWQMYMQRFSLINLYRLNGCASWTQAYSQLQKGIALYHELRSQKSNHYVYDVVSTIKKYIQTHYASEINLNTLAELVSYNETHVSRMFKQVTDVGVMEYLTAVRIDNAKKILQKSNDSILKIAEEVGFHSSQYFSNVFKKKTGMSPAEYRRRKSISSTAKETDGSESVNE